MTGTAVPHLSASRISLYLPCPRKYDIQLTSYHYAYAQLFKRDATLKVTALLKQRKPRVAGPRRTTPGSSTLLSRPTEASRRESSHPRPRSSAVTASLPTIAGNGEEPAALCRTTCKAQICGWKASSSERNVAQGLLAGLWAHPSPGAW